MFATDPIAPAELGAIEDFIADVLCEAHRGAHTDPDEARAILHVAELFAEALATSVPRFDRVEFIDTVTRDARED